MADLNSFSPIQHRTINETQPKGILTNKTNTITTTTNQNNYQQQPKVYQPATASTIQPPPTMPQPTATAPAFTKPFRPRSASVHSQKSIGDADDERNPANPTLREHPRKTVVAFGRTTKVEDTIKSIKTTTLPYKPPVGSTKDVMDLRKIVEDQSAQLQLQQDEIQKLKSDIHIQQEKYCFLLDSNSKLWSHLNNLEKQILATTNKTIKHNDHVMAKEIAKENIIHSNIGEHQPKDSIAVKKYREKEPKNKYNNNNEERQLVPAPTIKLAPELNAVSAVERYLNANPNRAKEIEKIAKELQKKKQQNKSEESEEEEEDTDRRKKEHRTGGRHHHHHRGDDDSDGVVEEKITLSRTIYKQPKAKNVRDYLSSTIDDSLQKFGMLTPTNPDRNHHHNNHHNRRPSPPTIHEVTSSASSSSDEFVEAPRRLSPERRRLHRRNKSDSDAENHRSALIEATNMPDRFDDDDMSSDTVSPQPPPRRERRQRVAERFKDRKR